MKKKLPAVGILSLIALFISSFPTLADKSYAETIQIENKDQEESSKKESVLIEKIKVVASPIIEGDHVNRYSSQLTLVTGEQISDLNAQDLPTALRRTPGIVISRHNPIGSFGGGEGGALFVRGMGSSRPGAEIQTLVDGVPVFVGVWTHPLMDVLSIDHAEKIEVYKGAQPVLYGNMAFGAINLITKRQKEEGFSTHFMGATGSYDSFTERIEHGGKKGSFDYYLIQSYRKSHGHRDNADGELQEYFARFGYDISEHWHADLLINHTDNWANDPGPEDGSIPPDGHYSVDDILSIATLANDYKNGQGHVKFYWNSGDIDWVGQYNETTGQNDSDTLTDYDNYGMRAREILHLWEDGEVVLGIDHDYISGEVEFAEPPDPLSKFDEEKFRITAPYLATSHQFGERGRFYLIPSLGFRYLSHSDFEDEWGFQAGLVLGYKKTEYHASYARGINYPGLNAVVFDEIFLPGDNQWENLDPEILHHFEAGISHIFNDKIKADIIYFFDDGHDRYVIVPPPPFPPIFENIEEFQTKGMEFTITVSPRSNLSFFGNVTYLDSEPSDLPYAPEWTSSLGLNYRFLGRFQISLDAEYVDDHLVGAQLRQKGFANADQVDSYYLMNGKLTYELTAPSRRLSGQIFLGIENLTDTNYELKKGYPMPGINGMVGLLLKF